MGWSPYRATGLTYHHAARSWKGYTLVTPLGGDSTFLLNMNGQIVHRWHFVDFRPSYGRLTEGGHLLILGNDVPLEDDTPEPRDGQPVPIEKRVRTMGGNASQLAEYSWDGERIWEYRNETIHHDFVRLPSGNIVLPKWVELDDQVARSVRGGFRVGRAEQQTMIGDEIIEIDAEGSEVWRSNIWEVLDPRKDAICPLEGREEWTHLNSLDVSGDGLILFSCRHNSRVGTIDRSTGALTWKYGFPETAHQHNAVWLPNGHVQIFDNGMHQRGAPRSRILEVNPKDNKVVWEYSAHPAPQFFSSHISGAERLPNGNVLICEGASGRVFEINRNGDVIWEWISPFVHEMRGESSARIFRAHRYGPDSPQIADRVLDPQMYADLNRLHGL